MLLMSRLLLVEFVPTVVGAGVGAAGWRELRQLYLPWRLPVCWAMCLRVDFSAADIS